MKARVGLIALSLVGVGLASMLARCSENGQTGDAGTDGALDARHFFDSGTFDAGSLDVEAGPYACGTTSDWPGFRRLTEFDPCLPVDVLVDGDAGFNLSWTNCDGDAGVAGCKQLVQIAPQVATYAYATYDDAGAGNILYLGQAIARNSNVGQYDIIDLKTSSRLGEWRIDMNYSNGTHVLLPNTTGTTTAFLGWRSAGLFAEFAPVQTLYSNPLTLTAYPSAPAQPINWAMSDQVMAFQPLSSTYEICSVGAGTCVPVNLASVGVAPYLAFAWHDVVFALAEHGTIGWAQEYVIHADGTIALLRSNPNAHVWAMTTDGMTLVWEETYGSTNFVDPQAKTEVWRAPFTTDKATLDATATKVTTLPTSGLPGGPGIDYLDFFNGLYATYLRQPTSDAIYVVDVATGQTQSVPRGAGDGMLGLPYVDRNELWEVTRTISYQDYLVRVPFAQPWN